MDLTSLPPAWRQSPCKCCWKFAKMNLIATGQHESLPFDRIQHSPLQSQRYGSLYQSNPQKRPRPKRIWYVHPTLLRRTAAGRVIQSLVAASVRRIISFERKAPEKGSPGLVLVNVDGVRRPASGERLSARYFEGGESG